MDSIRRDFSTQRMARILARYLRSHPHEWTARGARDEASRIVTLLKAALDFEERRRRERETPE